MQADGFCPDAMTYVCILKACGSGQAAGKGHEICAKLERQGLMKRNLIVGNALISMYVKCGYIAKAQHIFYNLSVRDRVSWNTLISGYANCGLGEEAFRCFEQMQCDGITPDGVTCVCCLKACCGILSIGKGQVIHAEIERQGFTRINHYVSSILVDFYGKCGLLAEAFEVFQRLPYKDVVIWNALLGGYIESGNGAEVLNFHGNMHNIGILPDELSYICFLKACSNLREIQKGKWVHAEIEKQGIWKGDPLINYALIDMYANCGVLLQAQHVFDMIVIKDAPSWNALIAGYSAHGHYKDVLRCYEQMQLEGVLPDAHTLVYTLKACGIIGAITQGTRLRLEIEEQGFLNRSVFICNALIDMYVRIGMLSEAQEVFDSLPVKDIVAWNTLFVGYAMHSIGEEALDRFQQMQGDGVCPNAVTYVCILKACSSLGAIDYGKKFHVEIERLGLADRDHVLGNIIVNMYARCGLLSIAKEVFNKLRVRDVTSWTALMTGYAHLGQSEDVFQFFDGMIKDHVRPNLVTYLVVLMACNRATLFDRSQTLFESMTTEHGVFPALEHHTCVIDLLGRSGKLDLAILMIRENAHPLDSVVWQSLLNACKRWGSTQIGEQAFKNIFDQI
ncbi:hypothetical protein KP509_04G034300 [Ceratopteris richardii]|nr:hypothetical protein KP509_04G034300 [Ceratopteris richardii]